MNAIVAAIEDTDGFAMIATTSPFEIACLDRETEALRPLAEAGAAVLVDVLSPDGSTMLTTKVMASGLLAAMAEMRATVDRNG